MSPDGDVLLTTGLALATPAQAQVSAYTFAASAGTYAPLPAGATAVPALLVDDATSGATLLPLGFSFVFDGTTYTGVKACSNGFLSFNPSASYNVGNVLGGTMGGTEKPLLAPLWDDLAGAAALIDARAAAPPREGKKPVKKAPAKKAGPKAAAKKPATKKPAAKKPVTASAAATKRG